MAAKTYSMCMNIDGFIHNNRFPRDFDIFQNDDGSALSPAEALAYLTTEKAKGHKVIPCSSECGNPCKHESRGCTGFDYSGRGCPGRYRELLELSAKSVGVSGLTWDARWGCLTDYEGQTFDPLTDDGDALRLLARLRLDLNYRPGYVGVCRSFGTYIGECPHDEDNPDDSAATRRAIVRAAAEIGKAMP